MYNININQEHLHTLEFDSLGTIDCKIAWENETNWCQAMMWTSR